MKINEGYELISNIKSINGINEKSPLISPIELDSTEGIEEFLPVCKCENSPMLRAIKFDINGRFGIGKYKYICDGCKKEIEFEISEKEF